MRRYKSGADLRQHLPGCAVCTSLCAVRSGQEAGGDRRSEDEPPNRSGYPSRRATTALSAGGTLPRPCCVPIIAFFPWFVNGFAEKFSEFFLLFSLAVVQDAQCVVGFLCKSAKGVVLGERAGRCGTGLPLPFRCLVGGKGGLPFWSPADFAVSESAGGLAFFVAC